MPPLAACIADLRQGPKVIKLEYSLRLKIKHNDWLLADRCPQSSQSLRFILSLRMKFYNLKAWSPDAPFLRVNCRELLLMVVNLCSFFHVSLGLTGPRLPSTCRVKSGNFGHQVNLEKHLQIVEIQMRRLFMSMSCLIRIFTVCLVNLFFIPIV